MVRTRRYGTDEHGYGQFAKELEAIVDRGYEVTVAVKSTGNTRYFKNRIEKLRITGVVVNKLKFKIINESVKKRSN